MFYSCCSFKRWYICKFSNRQNSTRNATFLRLKLGIIILHNWIKMSHLISRFHWKALVVVKCMISSSSPFYWGSRVIWQLVLRLFAIFLSVIAPLIWVWTDSNDYKYSLCSPDLSLFLNSNLSTVFGHLRTIFPEKYHSSHNVSK